MPRFLSSLSPSQFLSLLILSESMLWKTTNKEILVIFLEWQKYNVHTYTAVIFESGSTINCTAGIPPGRVISLQGTLVEPGPWIEW